MCERLGGDPPCWEHLLDDEGHLIEPTRAPDETPSTRADEAVEVETTPPRTGAAD
ncbi:MAG: hypothetical protein HY329_11690 [Chloroflexi bacterium]|nr:hypothetical protein [Chloroflexota bacterium]